MFKPLIFLLIIQMSLASRARDYVETSVMYQFQLADQVKHDLNIDKVYVFALMGFFNNAEERVIHRIRYLYKDNKVAVLSLSAQKTFKSTNEFNQFSPKTFEDNIGLFI